MIEPHFRKIRPKILKAIKKAGKEILVAMCWFTNHDLFDALCKKLSEDIPVSLIVLNDSINNRPDGLNFQKFIDLGGTFYYSYLESPMHNKYCIIDDSKVINGSYNWTHFAESKNYENITIINSNEIASLFQADFKRLAKACKLISIVKEEQNTDPYQPTIVEETRFASINDLIIASTKKFNNTNFKLITTIGENIHNDVYYPFIHKNTVIPTEKTYTLTTVEDNQITCNTDIRSGQNMIGSENVQIGKFVVEEIPPLGKGKPGLITTFSIDIYGILTVIIKVRETGKITINKFNIEHLITEQ